jgi:hypothetical protein
VVPLQVRRNGQERTLMLPVRNRVRTVETVQFDRNAGESDCIEKLAKSLRAGG